MKICKINDCQNQASTGRGMCHKHYKRWQMTGSVADTPGCRIDVNARLAMRGLRTERGCLEWVGTIGRNGYGQTKHNYKFYTVHKLAWVLANGTVPDGMYVCHKCDNKKCFEVSHLFLGTPRDNVLDAIEKGLVDRNRLKRYRAAWLKGQPIEASRRKV